MGINWTLYDEIDTFSTIAAAFLWHEIDPTEEAMRSPPHAIQLKRDSIIRAVEKLRGFDRSILDGPIIGRPRTEHFIFLGPREKSPAAWVNVEFVFRAELIKIAQEWNEKPEFLCSEAREKPLSPRKERSYLTLIKALLTTQPINPHDKKAAQEIQKQLHLNGDNLDLKTIRGILGEIREHTNRSKER
jgi:hypothetical protein